MTGRIVAAQAAGRAIFFVNLPNSITLARICCVPLLLWILSSTGFAWQCMAGRNCWRRRYFCWLRLTDGVDGYLARRTHQVTTLGMLLSPLADKLLVSTAYIALVKFAPALVPAWIAVLIVGREFLVTGLRSVAAQEGMTLDVRDIGKFKTVVQIISVVAVLMAHAWPHGRWEAWCCPARAIAIGAIWLMLAVSLLSAFAYLRAFWAGGTAAEQTTPQPAPVCGSRGPDDKNARA